MLCRNALQKEQDMKYSYEDIKKIIARSLSERGSLVVSIDGCCASGKSTLAQRLCADLDGDLIHADDFFLPPALRTRERLDEPGGNIHYERFYDQIIAPLLAAKLSVNHAADRTTKNAACDIAQRHPFSSHIYKPVSLPVLQWEHFSCGSLSYFPTPCHTAGKPLLIIEGAYCMRPEFRAAYDASFFLTTSYENQLARIQKRNGDDRLNAFIEKWIPMENRYFAFYDVARCCDYQIET